MNFLTRLTLRAKLSLLIGLSALAVIVSIAAATSLIHERMLADRVDKLHSVTQAALGLAQSLEDQVAAKQMTHEQALAQFGKAVHAIRFDNGDGYIVAQTLDTAMVVVHGANPGLDGKPSSAKDASGRLLTDLMKEMLKGSDETVISYMFAKPGETKTQPKVAYISRFRPWDVVFTIGANRYDIPYKHYIVVDVRI